MITITLVNWLIKPYSYNFLFNIVFLNSLIIVNQKCNLTRGNIVIYVAINLYDVLNQTFKNANLLVETSLL